MDRFYKLKRDGNRYSIPNGRTVDYQVTGTIDKQDVKEVFDFTYEMAYGKGNHRDHRSGGTEHRKPGEIFANTFQGKLAEYGLYYLLKEEDGSVSKPDMSVWGQGTWDTVDLEYYDQKIAIKSTKAYGQLLLLEKDDWSAKGEYISNLQDGSTAIYDYFVLIRMRPCCEEILKKNRLLYDTSADRDTLEHLVMAQDWTYDVPRFITNDDLVFLIDHNFVIPKGATFGDRTVMDATNIYAKAYDMRKADELKRALAYAKALHDKK